MCIVPTIATVYLYGFKEAGLVPSLRSIDFSYSKELLALSVRFFVLRITYVVLFTTDNMIISHVLGPEHVTTYNIAYKYFSMILLVYTTLTAPLWSAFTDAYTRHDMDWIRNTVRKMEKVWLGVFAAILLMLLASSFVYRLWLGGIIHVPFLLSCVMAIFILVYSWNSVFNLFINGTGKVMLQVILSVLAAAVNIPLSIFFSKNLGMGNTGVMTATIVCLLPLLISTPLQYRKIMAGTATGIWNA
jgi:O-antigen/teichoic acid export membrane protein